MGAPTPTDPPLARLVSLRDGGASEADFSAIVNAIHRAMAAGGHSLPALLDFSALRPERCCPHLLMAALRSSFSRRAMLPTWPAGLATCIDACALRGVDARKLLRGLL